MIYDFYVARTYPKRAEEKKKNGTTLKLNIIMVIFKINQFMLNSSITPFKTKYFVYGSKTYHLSFIKILNHCFTHLDVKYNK